MSNLAKLYHTCLFGLIGSKDHEQQQGIKCEIIPEMMNPYIKAVTLLCILLWFNPFITENPISHSDHEFPTLVMILDFYVLWKILHYLKV